MSNQDYTHNTETQIDNHESTTDGFSSATAMLQALNERRISSVELLELHLQRIHRYNATLNAVVVLDEEAARQSAKKADEMRSRGERAALLGLPMTIKESIDVKGLPGTSGVKMFAQ